MRKVKVEMEKENIGRNINIGRYQINTKYMQKKVSKNIKKSTLTTNLVSSEIHKPGLDLLFS